jgi:hypothetical protein
VKLAIIVETQAEQYTCGSCRFLEQEENNACCSLLNVALDVSGRWVAQRRDECLAAGRMAEALETIAASGLLERVQKGDRK